MPAVKEPTSNGCSAPEATRYAGWAALAGVLGIALIMIGVVLIAMLQAPVVPPRAIKLAIALMAAGLVLCLVAWRGRRAKS